MRSFFLVLFNNTFMSFEKAKDRILQCDKDLSIDNRDDLSGFVERSCSLAHYSGITEDALLYNIAFPFININDTVNVISCYNNTYYEYQKRDINGTAGSLCPINGTWTTWLSSYLQRLYEVICNSNSAQGYCINIHDTDLLNDIVFMFSTLDSKCKLTTTYRDDMHTNDNGLTSMIQNVSPPDRFEFYKLRVNSFINSTNELITQIQFNYNSSLTIVKRNKELTVQLNYAKGNITKLKQEALDLSSDKMLLERRLEVSQAQIVNITESNKGLHRKLEETTETLNKMNTSLAIVVNLIEKIEHTVVNVTDSELSFFNQQKTNYTDIIKSYLNNKRSINDLITNNENNIEHDEQQVEHLNLVIQNKTEELSKVYELLNITLNQLETLNITVIQFNKGLQHAVKRHINDQHNKIQDNYALSKQILDDNFDTRIAHAIKKIECIIIIMDLQGNYILTDQNEEKAIDYLQSNNPNIMTTVQVVNNCQIINVPSIPEENINHDEEQEAFMERYEITTDYYDALVKRARDRADNVMNHLQKYNEHNDNIPEENINHDEEQEAFTERYEITTDYYDALVKRARDQADNVMNHLQKYNEHNNNIPEENINHDEEQEAFTERYEITTDYYDALVKRARDQADNVMNHLQKYNEHNKFPPDDHPKEINDSTVDSYYNVSNIVIGSGSIALGAVALYLVNKYCFVITKWPIMAYKYIAKSCRITDTKINDGGVKLSQVEANDEYDTDDSFDDFSTIAPSYLAPRTDRNADYIMMLSDNTYEEAPNYINIIGEVEAPSS